jgi:hypothetical protein
MSNDAPANSVNANVKDSSAENKDRIPQPHEIERTSSVVARLARQNAGNEVEIRAIVNALKDRSFGVLMILFAMPNAVIPGISFILGSPIILFGLQMAYGRNKVWLPEFMMRQRVSDTLFQTIAYRVERFLVWIEKWMRPRLLFLFTKTSERLLGVYLAFLAAVLMAPIPFGNALPAFGISFISVGLIEKDGAAVIIGIILGFLGFLFVLTVILLGLAGLQALLGLI